MGYRSNSIYALVQDVSSIAKVGCWDTYWRHQGRILDRNLGHETPADMVREFPSIANRRPTAQKVVRHFAIDGN